MEPNDYIEYSFVQQTTVDFLKLPRLEKVLLMKEQEVTSGGA